MNASTLAPIALLLAAGCGVDNFASIQFLEICFPPAPTEGICVYPAKCTNTLLGLPLADVAAGRAPSLAVAVQMNNQLASNADPSSGRVNTNDAHIEKYTITYDNPLVPGVTALANDTVPVAGNTVVLVEVLPPASIVASRALVATLPSATLVASVVASGRYDSGSTFETGPYKIAVDVCNGCLGFNPCIAPALLTAACPSEAATLAGVIVSEPVATTCK